MKAEILFPEVCNLYGDLQNITYLKRCCPALGWWKRISTAAPAF